MPSLRNDALTTQCDAERSYVYVAKSSLTRAIGNERPRPSVHARKASTTARTGQYGWGSRPQPTLACSTRDRAVTGPLRGRPVSHLEPGRGKTVAISVLLRLRGDVRGVRRVYASIGSRSVFALVAESGCQTRPPRHHSLPYPPRSRSRHLHSRHCFRRLSHTLHQLCVSPMVRTLCMVRYRRSVVEMAVLPKRVVAATEGVANTGYPVYTKSAMRMERYGNMEMQRCKSPILKQHFRYPPLDPPQTTLSQLKKRPSLSMLLGCLSSHV